ncbi:hypothetical protein Cni_G05761 [Canna indica]|uniref:Uncharacterized protein n=1 Tax=Canna indica TaxID=4628 RepID=A0AAQ3JVG4_9LILI|nr:hypothetical protein Cni_G05761 [Canna indica]
MAGLQRSVTTYRRSGSSGVVWGDEMFLSGELSRTMRRRKMAGEEEDEDAEEEFRELRHCRSSVPIRTTTTGSSCTSRHRRSSHGFRSLVVSTDVSNDQPAPAPRSRRFLCCSVFSVKNTLAQRAKPRRR